MLTGTFLTKCYVRYRCNGKLYFAFFVPRNWKEILERREFGSHSARSTSLEIKLYFTTDVCSNGNSILAMELLLCSMILHQIVTNMGKNVYLTFHLCLFHVCSFNSTFFFEAVAAVTSLWQKQLFLALWTSFWVEVPAFKSGSGSLLFRVRSSSCSQGHVWAHFFLATRSYFM